jgi:hypothetical protein
MDPRARVPTPSSRAVGEAILAAIVAGGAIGAVLAVVVGAAAFPVAVGPLAYVAIVVVGSTAGSAIGVLAIAARRRG